MAAAAQQPRPLTGPLSTSWRQIVTPDLIVAGNAPNGELKRMLSELTRFRSALAQLFPDATHDSPVPTWLVLLRDDQAFQRFQPRDSRGKRQATGGYFSRGPDANLIVMPVSREAYALETIFHEYTHYFISRNVRTTLPGWLSEGLAEFYSTFRGDYRGDKTLVGAVPASTFRQLRSATFVPLRDIVAPRDLESRWRWQTQIGMYYAESWALVHYVSVARKNPTPNALNAYLLAFARTGNHDSAFVEAFGTDIDGMDRELREYVRRVTLPAMVYDVQPETERFGDAREMFEVDVDALEGRVLLNVGAVEDAERELTLVVKRIPTHVEGQIGLARLRLSQDRDDEAVAALQQVAAANPGHGPAHYYLGTALERAWRHEEALAVFAKALGLMPRNPAPWSGLNAAAVGLQRDSQAAAALQNAMQLEWSPSYYWSQALHALRLGRNDLAATSVAKYLELRGTGEDQSVYPLFIQAIAAWRAGRPADAEAALKLVEQADIEDWTRSVQQYLLGRLDEAQFLRAASDVGEQTEARTYVGFKIALDGREDEALAHFRWVAERGAKTYLEYGLARSELNRLKYRNTTPPAQ